MPSPSASQRVLVAQLGARRDYLVPRTVAALGMLEEFHTDFAIRSPFLAKVFAAAGRKGRSAAQRRVPDVPPGRIVTHETAVLSALIRCRREGCSDVERWLRVAPAFCNSILNKGLPSAATAAYSYTSTSLEIFQRCREEGRRTILDHATAPLSTESGLTRRAWEKWPEWFPEPRRSDSEELYAERQRAEWEVADTILCNSTFLKRMIEDSGGPVERCIILPLALPGSRGIRGVRPGGKRPLKALFVGDDPVRKALVDFAHACEAAGIAREDAEVIGGCVLTEAGRRYMEERVTLRGRLPKAEVMRLMENADVLILPSVSDTFGMVVVEAMSRGAIPIVTPNTGAADIVNDGESGFIVPLHAPDAIAECLSRLSEEPELREDMSRRAFEDADRFGVNRYREQVREILAAPSTT